MRLLMVTEHAFALRVVIAFLVNCLSNALFLELVVVFLPSNKHCDNSVWKWVLNDVCKVCKFGIFANFRHYLLFCDLNRLGLFDFLVIMIGLFCIYNASSSLLECLVCCLYLRQLVLMKCEVSRRLLRTFFVCRHSRGRHVSFFGQFENLFLRYILYKRPERFFVLSLEDLTKDEFVAFGYEALKLISIVIFVNYFWNVYLRRILLNFLLHIMKKFVEIFSVAMQVVLFLPRWRQVMVAKRFLGLDGKPIEIGLCLDAFFASFYSFKLGLCKLWL